MSGGTLDCQTNIITGGVFTLSNNSTLITANTSGINSAGAKGSIQSTTRNFGSAANYTYNGTAI